MALVARGSKLVDFLDVDIEDDGAILDYLQCKSGLLEIIDSSAVLDFVTEWNSGYCEENNLCRECRSPMQESFLEVPYGDTTVKESEGFTCGYCQY